MAFNFFKYKMHRISYIKLSILLLSMIGISNVAGGNQNKNYEKLKEPLIEKEDNSDQFQFEVIEDGTTEEEDMEKAVALRKTAFWVLMTATWNCDQKELNKPKDIGFKKSADQLVKFCETWKIMATVANEYVKKWECEKGQKRVDKIGTSSSKAHKTIRMKEIENSSKYNCMKPNFRLVQGKLQMSSAMEVIKGVYRDLFQWGDGKWMKIEVQFANEKEIKDSGFLIENFDCQNPDENMENLYIEKLIEFEKQFQQFFHVNVAKALNPLKTIKVFIPKYQIEEMKSRYDILLKMWKLVEELGFDFAHICDAGRNYKRNYIDVNTILKGGYNFKTNHIMAVKSIVSLFKKEYQFSMKEEELGQIFMRYKVLYDKVQKDNAELKEMYDKMPKKKDAEHQKMSADVPKNDAKEMKSLPDPCEQAKLRVKKN